MSRHLSPPTFHVSTVVGDKIFIPTLKTSATFLTSLSANLRIPDDELYPSPISTPLFRTSDATNPLLPPLSHLSAMTLSHEPPDDTYKAPPPPPPSPLDNLPKLTTGRAKTNADRTAALRLIADSVAQQRQTSSRAVIYHPIVAGGFLFVMLAVVPLVVRDKSHIPILLTTVVGLSTAFLFAVQWQTGGYIALAEQIGVAWLGEEDTTVLVTRWGEKVVGVVVLGWAFEEFVVGGRRFKKRHHGRKTWGLVRAWTVEYKYRGKGVGKALLEEAVQEVVKRGGEGIEFAEDHANHHRLTNPFFNQVLDGDERRAMYTLNEIARTQGNFGRRRS